MLLQINFRYTVYMELDELVKDSLHATYSVDQLGVLAFNPPQPERLAHC